MLYYFIQSRCGEAKPTSLYLMMDKMINLMPLMTKNGAYLKSIKVNN